MAIRKLPLFVIEDDPVYCEMVSDFIKDRYKRFRIHQFSNGEDAIGALHLKPKIIILDYFLDKKNPDAMNGLDVLKEIHNRMPDMRTVILSAQDDINVSVNMMKYGAYDYVVKNETDVYRIQNILNRILTMIDFDRKIFVTRTALFTVGALLFAVLVTLLFTL